MIVKLWRNSSSCYPVLDACRRCSRCFSEIAHTSSSTWTAILSACTSSGQGELALEHLHRMLHMSTEAGRKTILANLLKACSFSQSLLPGRLVHEEIMRTGLDSHTSFGNMIINMYLRCDHVEDASRVFDRLALPDVVSWGTMMMGYALHGHGLCALVLFENMQNKGLVPNTVVLLGLLKACLSLRSLAKACQAHDLIVRYRLETDVVLASMLIDMYNKLGNIEEGHLLFERLPDRNCNAVTWGALIAGYVQHGDGASALQLFGQIKQVGASPDNFVYSCVFRACNLVKSIEEGKRVHIQLIYCKLKLDVVVGNSLIDMYAKCGALDMAKRVFDSMLTRNVVSWGALIAGHVQYGNSQIALELHKKMKHVGLKPDLHTSSCLLKACGTIGALHKGRSIHEYILRRGYSVDSIIENALVDMYARCGSLEDVEKVFADLQSPDLVSWDAMIAGLVQHGKSTHALEMLVKMQEKGVHPDEITFLSMLKACGSVQAIEQGRLLNNQIVLKGFDSDTIVGNALIDMYAKCKSLEEARLVFDKLPKRAVGSWGVMISGYAQQEHIWAAIGLLNRMHCENVCADITTFLCILKACSKMRALKPGRQMHSQVLAYGYDLDLAVNNILLYMYAKCGSLQEAQKVFDRLPNRNVVTWDTLISGYVGYGDGLSALKLWSKMCEEGVKPIKVTFLCTLKACCSIGAMQQGRLLHHYIVRNGLDVDMAIGNTIIDMYAHCGSSEDASWLFDSMETPDLVTWNASITGNAYCGSYISPRQTLKDLQSKGLKPNNEIFLSLLSACRQAGLVKEGHWCFQFMTKEHGLIPSIEHCSCMVDLLGHAGCFKEATGFIQAMPCEPDPVVWTSLLASSNLYGNVELGNFCLKKLVELSYQDVSVYEQLSKHADLQDNFSMLDGVQAVYGMQNALEAVWNEHGGMVPNCCMVKSSSYSEDEAVLLKAKGLRREDSRSYSDLALRSELPGVEKKNPSDDSCLKQAGSFHQQRFQGDTFMHCVAICAF